MKSIPLSAHPAVVITGSTRGLGFALAREFALRGCRVTVSGRSAQGVEITLSRLLEAAAGALEDADPMRRIVNILGDPPHTVARYLVRKILSNKRNHAHFVWLTTVKILGRFLVAPFRKRDLFAETVERRD